MVTVPKRRHPTQAISSIDDCRNHYLTRWSEIGCAQRILARDLVLPHYLSHPFGRYRWRRLPFGISYAPGVFQRTKGEIVERLLGTEVLADDFIKIG